MHKRYRSWWVASTFGLAVALPPTFAQAAIFGGVEFPLGARSFADRVVSFEPGTSLGPPHNDPTRALGPPDGLFTALGNGGRLTLEFVDNFLVDQDDVEGGLDLFIFELGPAVEHMRVEISMNATDWIDLGVVSGQPTGIDIKPFINPGDQFTFVRISDPGTGPRSGFPFAGADIDAVGAIGAIPRVVQLPEPGSLVLVGLGLAGWALVRRRGRAEQRSERSG